MRIRYAANNNKVARSDGAFPLMELPPALPQDVDYDWYIKEAQLVTDDVDHPDNKRQWSQGNQSKQGINRHHLEVPKESLVYLCNIE